MTIKRFEDLKTWQAARILVNQVYDVTDRKPFAHDFGLRDQIRRAAGSTMHNIAEGFEAGSDAEFGRFLKYARRSASEVQSQLYIGLDRRYLTPDQFHTIYDQATQLKKLINGFIGYLTKSTANRRSPKPSPRPNDQKISRPNDQKTIRLSD